MTVKSMSEMSQEEKVLRHLERWDTITPKEAWMEYGIQRLSARIKRLREQDHDIATEQDGPHDYATYRLLD